MKPEPELIPKSKSWHCRNSVTANDGKGNENAKGIVIRKTISELVYGTLEVRTANSGVASTVIEGEAHHRLTGPTAESAIMAEAHRLNAKGYVPEPPKDSKPLAVDEPLFSGAELQKTVSYAPHYTPKRKRA